MNGPHSRQGLPRRSLAKAGGIALAAIIAAGTQPSGQGPTVPRQGLRRIRTHR